MRLILVFCLFLFVDLSLNSQPLLPLKGKSGETIVGNGAVSSFDATKDGKYLVVGTSLGVMIHDANTLELIDSFQEQEIVNQIVLSNEDSKVLSASSDGFILLWDIHTHEIYFSINEYNGHPFDIAISPDGKYIAVATPPPSLNSISDNEIQLWDVQSNSKAFTYKRPTLENRPIGYLNNDTLVTFSPDSKKLLFSGNIVSTDNNSISIVARIMDVDTGEVQEVVYDEPLRNYTTHFIKYMDDGLSFLMGFDSNIPSVSVDFEGNVHYKYNNIISEWNANSLSKENTHILQDDLGRTTAFNFISNSYAIVSQQMYDGIAFSTTQFHLVNLNTYESRSISNSINLNDPIVSNVSQEGFIYFTGTNGIEKWNTISNQTENILESYQYGFVLHAEFFENDTKIISIASEYYKETFNVNFKIITANPSNTVLIQDIQSGDVVQKFVGHVQGILAMDLSDDQSKLVTGGFDNKVIVWNTSNGEMISEVNEPKRVRSVTFFPDGEHFITSSGTTPIIWESSTGQVIGLFDGENMHQDTVTNIKIDPTGTFVVTGSADGTAKLWEINLNNSSDVVINFVKTFEAAKRDIENLDISPDGKFLATVSLNTTITVWDINSGEKIITLQNNSINVPVFALIGTKVSVAFSPDGTRLAAGGAQRLLSVWDTTTWELKKSFEVSPFYTISNIGISHISFSQDGKRILTVMGNQIGDNEYTARIWQIEEPSSIESWLQYRN